MCLRCRVCRHFPEPQDGSVLAFLYLDKTAFTSRDLKFPESFHCVFRILSFPLPSRIYYYYIFLIVEASSCGIGKRGTCNRCHLKNGTPDSMTRGTPLCGRRQRAWWSCWRRRQEREFWI